MNNAELREMGRRYRELAARDDAPAGTYASGAPAGKAQAMPETPEPLSTLIARVDRAKPQPEDLAALRAALERDGLQGMGALSAPAQDTALVVAIEGGQGVRMVIAAEVAAVKRTFGYADCSPVERLLIDHIGTCWLRLQLAEHTLTGVTARQHTLNEGAYREKRLTEAQTRYLRAVALLERLRRYSPNVQINIANQQVVNG